MFIVNSSPVRCERAWMPLANGSRISLYTDSAVCKVDKLTPACPRILPKRYPSYSDSVLVSKNEHGGMIEENLPR